MPPKAAKVLPFLDVAPSGANTIILQTKDDVQFEVPQVWTFKLELL